MSKGDPGMGANMTANPWGGAQAFLAQLMRPGQQHGMLNQQQMPGWQQQFGGPGMLNQMPGWQAQILPQPSPPPATSAGPALVPQPAAAAPAAAAAAELAARNKSYEDYASFNYGSYGP